MCLCRPQDENLGWAGNSEIEELGEPPCVPLACVGADVHDGRLTLRMPSAKPFVSNVPLEGDPNYYLYTCQRA